MHIAYYITLLLYVLSGDRKMPDVMKDVLGKAGHVTTLSGSVFKGEKAVKDEEYLEGLCPDTDVTLLGKIANAAVAQGWKTDLEGLNEYDLFLAQYAKLKQVASRRLGVAALELFDRYQKTVEAAILMVTSDGTETGNFYGQRAKVGSVQWFIRPIMPESVQLKVATAAYDRTNLIYKYGTATGTAAAGQKGVIQRKDSALGTGTDQGWTLTQDKQMLVIFGYVSSLNPRAILEVQEHVNDGVGARIPIDIYGQMNMTDIGLATRPGALVVNEGKLLRVAAHTLVSDIYSDIMPFGVDICTADTGCLLDPLFS